MTDQSLTWLHVSDIHFRHGDEHHQLDQALVLNALRDDVFDLLEAGRVPRPDLVLVTGDIGTTGAGRDSAEYDAASEWFREVLAGLGLDGRSVLCVPGNHDVDRGVASSNRMLKYLLTALRSDDDDSRVKVDSSMSDDEESAAIGTRFKAYRAFVSEIGSPSLSEEDSQDWQYEVVLGADCLVRFVGLNTALLSADDQDYGRLQLGLAPMVRHLAARPRPNEIVVVLAHHPLSWLRDHAATEERVRMASDIFLVGHVHVAGSVDSRRGGQPHLVTIEAGATHGDTGEPVDPSYNFTRLSLQAGKPRVDVWPRAFRDGRFRAHVEVIDDETTGSTTHYLQREVLTPQASGSADPIHEAALATLSQLGSRRTAFPEDLSIAELAESDLIVGQQVVRYGSGDSPHTDDEIVERLASGDSVLLLGAPGSGKSVSLFTIATRLLESKGRAPLSLSLARFAGPPINPGVIAEHLGIGDVGLDHVVFVVDGLDEALAAGVSPGDVVQAVDQIRELGPTVAACRVFEYESLLRPQRLWVDRPHDVFVVEDWSPSVFWDFVGRLDRAGHIAEDQVREGLSHISDWDKLVARPLFARMLTWVLANPDESQVIDTLTSLYRAYLWGLGRVADDRIIRTVGGTPASSYEVWRSLAWFAYSRRLMAGDSVPAATLIQNVIEQGNSYETSSAVVNSLFDSTFERGEVWARPRHYSFYEYLVADYVAKYLFDCASVDGKSPGDVLRYDLTPEIRWHLKEIAKYRGSEAIGDVLVQGFGVGDQSDTERRTSSNLAAYLIGRLGVPTPTIARLIAESSDRFVQTALYWALANAGDQTTVADYLSLLESDSEMSALNRGYLLYYYSDLDRRLEPPYLDLDPGQSWENTRTRVTDLLGENDYRSKPATRRALDIATHLDMYRFHRDIPTRSEMEILDVRVREVLEDADDSIASVIARGFAAIEERVE